MAAATTSSRGLRAGAGAAVLLRLAVATGVAVALALAACRPSAPRNVVLISIDTLRPDHLGAYGYARATSPNLDALASRGALFETAVSPSSWTLPAHASMLTGVSPFRHGAIATSARIRDDVSTLAERLRSRGYVTMGFINAPFVSSRHGFERGFESFTEHYRRPRRPAAYHRQILEAIAAAPRDRPVFLFVHYMDVHSPYRPPAEFNRFVKGDLRQDALVSGRTLRDETLLTLSRDIAAGRVKLSEDERELLIDLYDGEILAMDAKIGQLLAAVRDRLGDQTLVIVTSDHGEEFLEHGGILHGETLYEEVLRVPLIVAGGGVAPGARPRAMVSLLDLMPTVLEWTGSPGDPVIEGRSLVGLLGGGGAGPERREIALHTIAADNSVDLRGVRVPDAKLIRDVRDGRSELYDLASDPGERHNLESHPQAAALGAAVARLAPAPPARAAQPDAGVVEALRALGYL